MKLKRNLQCMLLAVILALSLTLAGCANVVETETTVVNATIVEVDRDPIMKVGMAFKPADYDILLTYGDIETWIDISRSEYDEYKDLVGTTIEAHLVVDHYDDGTIECYLKLIED